MAQTNTAIAVLDTGPREWSTELAMEVNWAAVARRTQMLARALQVDDVLSQALDGGDEIGADGAAVWLFDRSSYRLELATERGLGSPDADDGHRDRKSTRLNSSHT